MARTHTPADEQAVLDYIRFWERQLLRTDQWINPHLPPGTTSAMVAANMKWWLPQTRGEMAEPDMDRSNPVLEALVRKGKLVELGKFQRNHGMLQHYATPDFKRKFEENNGNRLWSRGSKKG